MDLNNFLITKHESIQNNKEWSQSFFKTVDWRKDAIMFFWPLEEEEGKNHIFLMVGKTAEN